MTALWTQGSAVKATGGSTGGTWEASRVVIDSRSVRPGDLFVAIKGERFDGHAFVTEALAKGAAAVVVSYSSPIRGEGKVLVVKNTLTALEDLGRYARARSQARIVGITGSVGKTSAKDMLRLALSAHGETYATKGNLNNHIGTPLNLANLPPDAPFAVFEMGMNHAGEIAHLTRMVRPHVAAITNVEAVHMEFFENIEGIARAKAEIFEGVEPGGVAIINTRSHCPNILENAAKQHRLRIMRCGGDDAECNLVGNTVRINGKIVTLWLNAIGKHWEFTALLSLAAVDALGLDVEKSAAKLAEFQEPEGRGRVVPVIIGGKPVVLIDDSYNASPVSMRAAFDKVCEVGKREGGQGRKIAALGDMLELGAQGPSLHAALAEDLQASGFDSVFTAGGLMRHLYEALPPAMQGAHVAEASHLLPLLVAQLQAGDILLLKGSHGSNIYELAKALTDAKGETPNAL